MLKNKSDLRDKVKTLLTDLKIVDLEVKFIRYNNAGEDLSMKNITTSNPPELTLSFQDPDSTEWESRKEISDLLR